MLNTVNTEFFKKIRVSIRTLVLVRVLITDFIKQ